MQCLGLASGSEAQFPEEPTTSIILQVAFGASARLGSYMICSRTELMEENLENTHSHNQKNAVACHGREEKNRPFSALISNLGDFPYAA